MCPTPGALAEYLIVDDVRHLVPLGDLDPVESVSLTDAGLTPYHAIVSSLDALPEDSAWDALEPSQRRQRTLDAVRALLLPL